MYEDYLESVENVMGKNITYENEINKNCKALFGELWGGAFARDKMEKILERMQPIYACQ